MIGTVANAESFVRLNPNAHPVTWYEGATYQPTSSQIRGIPVNFLNKQWCAADELRTSDLPEKIAKQVEFEQRKYGWRFQHENLLLGHLRNVSAVVGIAKNCDTAKTAFFVLLIDQKKQGKDAVIFVTPFEEANYVILSIRDKRTIDIGFCSGCDDIIDLRLKRQGFYWVEYAMGDGDDVERRVKK